MPPLGWFNSLPWIEKELILLDNKVNVMLKALEVEKQLIKREIHYTRVCHVA